MLRFLLIVWVITSPTAAPFPLTIPQSTQISCDKAAQKLRADLKQQDPKAMVLTACVDTGSQY